MPLKSYGVLAGRAVDRRREGSTDTPHYQIHLVTSDDTSFRVAVNVQSQESPSELLYLVDEHVEHPLTGFLSGSPDGFRALPPAPGGANLDYIRANLFDHTKMQPLPPDVTGPDNDLADLLDHYVERAIADPAAVVHAFGERFGPESAPDKVFGFQPGNGVHDIHMNQGNGSSFSGDDGVWQDGGLLLHFPGAAAMVNPVGPSPEQESVLLLNASPDAVDLTGWRLADRLKQSCPTGEVSIGPGETIRVGPPPSVQLGNNGGAITLLDANAVKVDGVAYTSEQAKREGWTVVF